MFIGPVLAIGNRQFAAGNRQAPTLCANVRHPRFVQLAIELEGVPR